MTEHLPKLPAYNIREIAFLALLTACNSALELTVGNILHLIDLPMKGSVMVGLNLLVYAVVFRRMQRFGAITMVGVATAFVNFIISGGFKIFALWCIVAEALVIDGVLAGIGLSYAGLITAGIAAGIASTCCGMINAVFFFVGGDAFMALRRLAGPELAGKLSVGSLIAAVLACRVVVGTLFGIVAARALELLRPVIDQEPQP